MKRLLAALALSVLVYAVICVGVMNYELWQYRRAVEARHQAILELQKAVKERGELLTKLHKAYTHE